MQDDVFLSAFYKHVLGAGLSRQTGLVFKPVFVPLFVWELQTAAPAWFYLRTAVSFRASNPCADQAGLHAFELPLAYLRGDKFNQPIFGCNNLSGECWPAVAGGGPAGGMPPHKFALYFKRAAWAPSCRSTSGAHTHEALKSDE